MKNIIFLFSLPRSGSTLLQRILMTHSKIKSISEPWLLLPIVHMLKKDSTLSYYSHTNCCNAIEDLIKNLPNEYEDFYKHVNTFITNVYNSLCDSDKIYFLDKTPRYYLIIPEIFKIFPKAKFIFLFRNPIQILSSIIETWGNGTLKHLFHNYIDITKGFDLLSKGYNEIKHLSYSLNYEDFLENPQKKLYEIASYLEIDYEEHMLTKFNEQKLHGRMGDPTGIKKYNKISKDSLNNWKKTFGTFFRKKLLFNYINSLDENSLNIQGYKKEELLNQIKDLKVSFKYSLKDLFHFTYSYAKYSKNLDKIKLFFNSYYFS